MSLDRFQLFVTTAKHLSVTRASREHHISQPAASRKLRLLQDDFKVTLFRRKGRGLDLTDTGRDFLKHAAEILEQIEELKKNYREHMGESIAIAASRGPSAVLLPSLITRFKQSHPFVNLSLYRSNSTEIRPWLRSSTVDFAVITTPPASHAFHVEPYRIERLTAFIAPTHPFAKQSLSSTESATLPLIVRSGKPTQTRTERELLTFKNRRIKLLVVMRCGSSRGVKDAVASGMGIGILYDDAVRQEIDHGRFTKVEIPGLDLTKKSYLVYSREKALSPMARDFLTLLRASKK